MCCGCMTLTGHPPIGITNGVSIVSMPHISIDQNKMRLAPIRAAK